MFSSYQIIPIVPHQSFKNELQKYGLSAALDITYFAFVHNKTCKKNMSKHFYDNNFFKCLLGGYNFLCMVIRLLKRKLCSLKLLKSISGRIFVCLSWEGGNTTGKGYCLLVTS